MRLAIPKQVSKQLVRNISGIILENKMAMCDITSWPWITLSKILLTRQMLTHCPRANTKNLFIHYYHVIFETHFWLFLTNKYKFTYVWHFRGSSELTSSALSFLVSLILADHQQCLKIHFSLLTFAGFMYDVTTTYVPSFMLSGGALVCCSVFTFCDYYLELRERRNQPNRGKHRALETKPTLLIEEKDSIII